MIGGYLRRTFFARLRHEDPVHYQASSPFGPFWSITRFEDIVAVDTDHGAFSSVPAVVIGDPLVGEEPLESFITMDPPKHDLHRRAAQPVVAPQNLAAMEGLIRSRVVEILDGLHIGENFNWVERVSINLTTQMLATLFDFPFEQRQKLTYWSDIGVGSPEIAGGNVSPEEREHGLDECVAAFTQLPIGRDAVAHPVGGNHAALSLGRSPGRTGAGALELRAGLHALAGQAPFFELQDFDKLSLRIDRHQGRYLKPLPYSIQQTH